MIEGQSLITELGALSYAGVWGVSLVANVVIPVPEEVVVLSLGYLAGTGSANIWILLPIVISAFIVTDTCMYLLSLHGARPIMWFYKKFFAKHFSHGQLDWMSTHIGKIVFFSRFLVQLRFIGPFMAGQKKMSFWSFVMYDGLAVLIYAPLYLFLGLFFHSRIQSITHNIGVVQNIILIMVGLAIAFGFFKYMYRKFFEKKDLLTSDQTEITK